MQKLLKGLKAFKDSPSVSILAPLSEQFRVLRPAVCIHGRTFCAGLLLLEAHALFLSTLRESSIGPAIASLKLRAYGGALKTAHEHASATDPGRKPFRAWVELDLVEASANHVVRTLDMSVTARAAELARGASFFEEYLKSVSSSPFFSEPLRGRAAAMKVLSDSLTGKRVVPTVIEAALASLTTVGTLEITRAYSNYKAGKEYVLHARSVVERNADDLIADRALGVVQAALSPEEGDEQETWSSFDVGLERLELHKVALQRLHEALSCWSDLRLEEQLPQLKEVVVQVCMLPVMADFAFGMTMMKDLAQGAAALTSGGGGVAPAQVTIHDKRALRGAMIRLHETFMTSKSVVERCMDRVLTDCGGVFQKMLQEKGLQINLGSAIGALRKAAQRWGVVDNLLSCMCSAMTLDIDYEQSDAGLIPEEALHMDLADDWSKEKKQRRPYMWHIMEFCERREQLKVAWGDHLLYESPSATLPEECVGQCNDAMKIFYQLVVASAFSGNLIAVHCVERVRKSLATWTATLRCSSVALVSSDVVEVNEIFKVFPMLVAGKDSLNTKTMRGAVGLDNGLGKTNMGMLPQVKAQKNIYAVAGSIASNGDLYMPCFQKDDATEKLQKADLLFLISLHGAVDVVIRLAACAHEDLRESGAPTVQRVEALRVLLESINHVEDLATSASARELSTKLVSLHLPVRHLLQADRRRCSGVRTLLAELAGIHHGDEDERHHGHEQHSEQPAPSRMGFFCV